MRKVFICILPLLFLVSCSVKQPETSCKPKITTLSPVQKEMLSRIIANRYNNEVLKFVQTDIEYRKYLLSLAEETNK